MKTYDVAIIGMGISGLTSHAILTKQGMNVLGIERRNRPGGLLSSFERGGVPFVNLASSFIMGCRKDGYVSRLLGDLGIDREVDFVAADSIGKYFFPDDVFINDIDSEIVKEKLFEMFPEEAKAISEYYKVIDSIYKETMNLIFRDIGFFDYMTFPFRNSHLVRYGNTTVGDYMYKHFKEEKLISHLLAPTSEFMPGPVLPISFVVMALLSSIGHKLGISLIQGGTYRLTRAFQKAIIGNGGDILTNRSVTRIVTNSGNATGIELDDGEIVNAKYVISCVDSYQTFFEFLGENRVPKKHTSKIKRMKLGPCASVVYLALTDPPDKYGIQYGPNAYFNSYAPDQWWENNAKKAFFDSQGSFTLYNLSTEKHVFAEEGVYPIMMAKGISEFPDGDLTSSKQKIIDAYQDNLTKLIPNIREKVIIEEVFTPQDFQKFDSIPNGAVGWFSSPDQVAQKSIPPTTFLKNLYLAGQWTSPGQGINCCMISAMEAARQIFKNTGNKQAVKYIEGYRETLL